MDQKQLLNGQEVPPAPTESLATPLCMITVENTKNSPRLQWTKTTVAFSKGEMLDAVALDGIGVQSGFYEWKILKWHFENGLKHSIALAQLKFVAYMTGPGVQLVPLQQATKTKFDFQLHANVQSYLNQLFQSVICKLKVSGDSREFVAFPLNTENLKLVSATASGITYRARTIFKTQTFQGLVTGKLSLTSYVEVNYQDPMIKTTMVVGNDVLETPQQGGVAIESLRFESSQRVILSTLMPGAYGISFMGDHFVDAITPATHFSLGDGQTVAFRVNLFVKATDQSQDEQDWLYRTFRAECEEPLMPTIDYQRFKDAKALNLYQEIAPVRFSNKAQAKNTAEQFRGAPIVSPNAISYLGGINQNPAATGAQPDFAATVPSDILEALQVNSQKLLFKALMKVDREAMRPSYYWQTKSGYQDRISMVDFPNLFFWSSRPHYDFSWNAEYPIWRSRTTAQNFDPGYFNGYNGHDNQHLSNNHLRTMYELTGDAYLGDLCEHYIEIIYWNFFTRYLQNVEAERTNRTMKDAVAHATLFIDSPKAQTLLAKVAEKMSTAFTNEVNQNIQNFAAHSAAVAPFNSCDPRVMSGQYCVTQGNPNIVAVCWQMGFHMEFLNLMIQLGFARNAAMNLAQLYQNSIGTYFLEDGTPKTYMLLTDPNTFETGGIGVYWWSGWCQLAKYFAPNPRIQALSQIIKAQMTIGSSEVVAINDSWNSF